MNLKRHTPSLILTLLFAVCLHMPLYAQLPPGPHTAVIDEVIRLMDKHHYDPAELRGDEYRKMLIKMEALGLQNTSTAEFVDQFNALWKNGPFSHVRMGQAKQSASDLAGYLDNLRVGESACQLSWEGNTAILTVNTMMGLDTIEQIDMAYQQIAERQAERLIIDLRQNEGGAFAVKPLVGHLISEPLDAGVFVSQAWNAQWQRPPTLEEIQSIAPWEGWSIRTFWQDAQNNVMTRVQFQPMEPVFSGPVFVLQSHKTASAAELAIDALANLENVTLLGEKTAGQMLSQKVYDLPEGLHLYLPIADYYGNFSGRVEGHGVQPDVKIKADTALDYSLKAD